MSQKYKYGLFNAFGIEIEYMIVDSETLLPVPIAHALLTDECGRVSNSIQIGDTCVSNELAAHVIEIKTAEPTADFEKAAVSFQTTVDLLNRKLEPMGAMLAPGGMHPFMKPKEHSGLWQYDDREIYEWYDATFGCRSHGWLNLQSCHLNLPFQNETEFALLHDAIIVALPLLPALSAASPYVEGRHDGHLDTRLLVYAGNQKRFPAISGALIPESIHDEESYKKEVLLPAYESVKHLDPDRIIQSDWLNSRGAIARFDRGSVEIRILDTQENPRCDLAICDLLIRLLRRLVLLGPKKLGKLVDQFSPIERRQHLMSAASNGAAASLAQRSLVAELHLANSPQTLGDFWNAFLAQEEQTKSKPFESQLIRRILSEGTLAQRMLRLCGARPEKRDLENLLKELGQDLAKGPSRSKPAKTSPNNY